MKLLERFYTVVLFVGDTMQFCELYINQAASLAVWKELLISFEILISRISFFSPLCDHSDSEFRHLSSVCSLCSDIGLQVHVPSDFFSGPSFKVFALRESSTLSTC